MNNFMNKSFLKKRLDKLYLILIIYHDYFKTLEYTDS